MKFTVSMKDPDTLIDAIEDAVKGDGNAMEGLDADEREVVIERRKDKVANLCGKWFRYGEVLTVEIDTDAKTCTVVEAK